MAIDAQDNEDLELAHRFARAYRDLDEAAMQAALAPAARVRILMPRGFSEHEGADKLLAPLRDMASKWTTEGCDAVEVELLEQNMLQTGRLACIGHRLRLRSAAGDRTATVVMKHIIAIKDGRIALVDELCTGIMP